MKGLRIGGVTTLAYTDDIVLVAYKPNELQNALSEWNNVLKAAKMKINVGKTEVMMVARQKEEVEIRLDGEMLKLVEEFKYLGVKVDENFQIEKEIANRIQKYTNNLRILYPLMKEKVIPKKVKTTIYQTILRPVLTYGSETWTLTEKLKSKIQAAEMSVKINKRCNKM